MPLSRAIFNRKYQAVLCCICFILLCIIILPDNYYITYSKPDKTVFVDHGAYFDDVFWENNFENVSIENVSLAPVLAASLKSVANFGDFEKLFHTENNLEQEMTCINIPKTYCYPLLRSWFEYLVKRKAKADDEELVRFARQLIEPPSSHPTKKLTWGIRSTPQSEYVDRLLNQKTDGFFVEAGAQDGERASNTAWLEFYRNWTGLLVETDPWFYTQMRGKMRNAYIVNVGLSPTNYITELEFQESYGGHGKALGRNTPEPGTNVLRLPCLPIETLLLAIDQKSVDYFSLDVEGIEISVLKSFPFSNFPVNVWSIEYSHIDASWVKKYLLSNGYAFMAQLDAYEPQISLSVADYIFQHISGMR